MAELPWKSLAQPVPDREYVAILTYLPLKNFSTLPQFFYYTGRIQSQLKSAPGLIGYSLVAICSRKILDVVDVETRPHWRDSSVNSRTSKP